MSDWRAFSLEEFDTERVLCDCCRDVTIRGSGHLFLRGDWHGWYTLRSATSLSPHPAMLTVYLGDWSDHVEKDARWAIQVQWSDKGCGVLDWDAEELETLTTCTPLGRSDVIGSPFEAELWSVIDAIIMKDSRLKELHA